MNEALKVKEQVAKLLSQADCVDFTYSDSEHSGENVTLKFYFDDDSVLNIDSSGYIYEQDEEEIDRYLNHLI